jgi:hypothetical protein
MLLLELFVHTSWLLTYLNFMYCFALWKFTVVVRIMGHFSFPVQYHLEGVAVNTILVSQPHENTHFHAIGAEF